MSARSSRGILAQRLTGQLLAGAPAPDPVAVAGRLLAVQAQDPRGVRLAIRARTHGVSAADVDRALSEERSILITWLNRGTLHLVRAEDYPWLHMLTAPTLMTTSTTRLAQEGVDPSTTETAMRHIRHALHSDGPLTRAQIGERLERRRIPTSGQALIHLLFRATLERIAVRGPIVGRDHAYVLVEDWLGPQAAVSRDSALAELARRYLRGHAPADDRDLARWSGLALREARSALGSVASELAERGDGLLELKDGSSASPLPPPRLLGAFEPLLLGWCSRDDVLGDRAATIVRGGIFGNFALAGGRAVGGWRFAGQEITIEPFGDMSATQRRALTRDALAVRRFFGWQ